MSASHRRREAHSARRTPRSGWLPTARRHEATYVFSDKLMRQRDDSVLDGLCARPLCLSRRLCAPHLLFTIIADPEDLGARRTLAAEHGLTTIPAKIAIRAGIDACAESLRCDVAGKPGFVVHDHSSTRPFIQECSR